MMIIEEMTIPANDLGRFVQAQDELFCDYGQALKEVREGYKSTHWIWYIFPQLRALGHSRRARYFGISDLDEAVRYMKHPVLSARDKHIHAFQERRRQDWRILLIAHGREIFHREIFRRMHELERQFEEELFDCLNTARKFPFRYEPQFFDNVITQHQMMMGTDLKQELLHLPRRKKDSRHEDIRVQHDSHGSVPPHFLAYLFHIVLHILFRRKSCFCRRAFECFLDVLECHERGVIKVKTSVFFLDDDLVAGLELQFFPNSNRQRDLSLARNFCHFHTIISLTFFTFIVRRKKSCVNEKGRPHPSM